ncbi:MAG: alpha/beta hydrolase, partial [Lachnospiraceae bacterium]|nr:alpha/beta hydrolase [Lachnospiraceae bacterium]
MKKLAVMFPGVGYTMDFPLLYYESFLYYAKGYEQIHMKYNSILFDPDLTKEEKTLKAREYIWEKAKDIDFSAYDEVVFLSKSFGTAEAGYLAEKLEINPVQIYLTPVP